MNKIQKIQRLGLGIGFLLLIAAAALLWSRPENSKNFKGFLGVTSEIEIENLTLPDRAPRNIRPGDIFTGMRLRFKKRSAAPVQVTSLYFKRINHPQNYVSESLAGAELIFEGPTESHTVTGRITNNRIESIRRGAADPGDSPDDPFIAAFEGSVNAPLFSLTNSQPQVIVHVSLSTQDVGNTMPEKFHFELSDSSVHSISVYGDIHAITPFPMKGPEITIRAPGVVNATLGSTDGEITPTVGARDVNVMNLILSTASETPIGVQSIKVNRASEGGGNPLQNLRLFQGTELLGSVALNANSPNEAVFPLNNTALAITNTAPTRLKLVADISPAAIPGASVRLSLASRESISVAAPDRVAGNFPLQSNSLTVAPIALEITSQGPVSLSVVSGTANVEIAKIQLKNNSANPITISSLLLDRIGTLPPENFSSYSLIDGSTPIPNIQVSSEGPNALRVRRMQSGMNLLSIPPSSTKIVVLRASVQSSAPKNFQLALPSPSHVGVASNVRTGIFPATGPLITVIPIQYGQLTINRQGPATDEATAGMAQKQFEKLNMTAWNGDVKIDKIRITGSTYRNEGALTAFVAANSLTFRKADASESIVPVASKNVVNEGSAYSVVFDFSPDIVIPSGTTQTFIVKGNIQETAPANGRFAFGIFGFDEAVTGLYEHPLSGDYSNWTWVTVQPRVTMNSMAVVGRLIVDKISVVGINGQDTDFVYQGTNNLAIAKYRFQATRAPVIIQKIKVSTEQLALTSFLYANSLKIVDEANPAITLATNENSPFIQQGSVISSEFTFSPALELGKNSSKTLLIVGSVRDDAPVQDKFYLIIRNENDISGLLARPITGTFNQAATAWIVKQKQGKLTMNAVRQQARENVTRGTSILLGEYVLSATDGADVKITKITVNGWGFPENIADFIDPVSIRIKEKNSTAPPLATVPSSMSRDAIIKNFAQGYGLEFDLPNFVIPTSPQGQTKTIQIWGDVISSAPAGKEFVFGIADHGVSGDFRKTTDPPIEGNFGSAMWRRFKVP